MIWLVCRMVKQLVEDEKVLPPASDAHFTILVKHRPSVTEAARKQADLQLSGHTHGGQIFPFNFFVRLSYDYNTGLHSWDNGFKLYVSPGTGTWGPPMRLFARPEIAVLVLDPSQPD